MEVSLVECSGLTIAPPPPRGVKGRGKTEIEKHDQEITLYDWCVKYIYLYLYFIMTAVLNIYLYLGEVGGDVR